MPPGARALTRTPDDAHSQAALSVSVSIPPRAAAEWPNIGQPFEMSAMMLTIVPPFACIQRLKTSRMKMKPPVRLFFTTVSKPLVEIVSRPVRYWPPALLTRPSMRPVPSSTRVIVAITPSSSRMSQA